MHSPIIEGLRSVALNVPDLEQAEKFYCNVWNLQIADREPNTIYFRGTGSDPYLLVLHKGEKAEIRHVTLRARQASDIQKAVTSFTQAGGTLITSESPLNEFSGGTGVMLRDPVGRYFQIIHGDQRRLDIASSKDHPIRLAHAVLNSQHVNDCQTFLAQALGFVMIDRTKIMAFMNCNFDHHSLAFGDADNNALNHIAFLMPDVDSVMRGGGRMKDEGYPIEWGPGRHGPGDNTFNYFVGPFGEVIEYTANVEQVDTSYKVGLPDDWTWPTGRVDQWGISSPPSQRLKRAQRCISFIQT